MDLPTPGSELRRRFWPAAGLLVVLIALFTWLPRLSRPAAAPVDLEPLRSVATTRKDLALTFDISWGTVMPPKVLSILEREKVPATIFISGPWAKQNPEIIKRLYKDGLEIESHGWKHVNYSQLASGQIAENIQKADEALKSIVPVTPRFIRPPNGDYSKRVAEVAAGLGYRLVIWDTDSRDWMNPGVANIINRVTQRAHPGDIVLLHASDTCKQTDLALPAIIRDLRTKGYRFLTLKDLLKESEGR